ncbi:MAG: hypothetical protein ACLFT0_18200 [Spirulinaceae cyanobacterium]
MKLNQRMIEVFGIEELVYASSKTLFNIVIEKTTKEFILNTGFPHRVGFFRFSMDFNSILEDIQIRNKVKHLGSLYTIGSKTATQLIGTTIQLSEFGLNNSASLSDISRAIENKKEENFILEYEINSAHRICFDLKTSKILCVDPEDLSITLLNSSIQQLANSILTYANVSSKNEFLKKMQEIDPKAVEHQESWWMLTIDDWFSFEPT